MNLDSKEVRQLASELVIKSMEPLVQKEVNRQASILIDITKDVIDKLCKSPSFRKNVERIIFRSIHSDIKENGLPDRCHTIMCERLEQLVEKEFRLRR